MGNTMEYFIVKRQGNNSTVIQSYTIVLYKRYQIVSKRTITIKTLTSLYKMYIRNYNFYFMSQITNITQGRDIHHIFRDKP